ncbi:methyltransferase family protein [Tamaricihabitans halophyticus]|uniref:Methyltransferase family protein n=1 Tax=Tamaricihabitans halophyticus TaxID=1262583 RepID=A0A4V2SV01_9PSEU|nr:class I SAM-dependent methyltransferase [Tamaricihabitans halophyticus]TCP56456.1 methyltransferase family protein [Tamaricihabitans halophyticus]
MSTYGAASAHYLSPRRRDPVKVGMEELVSHEIFAGAVAALNLPTGADLRVLDLGSGTGDGFALLTKPHGDLAPVTANYRLSYLGLDANPAMVATAREVYGAAGAEFTLGDIRGPLPEVPVDLYLSCGVPYSHLTEDEVAAALRELFDRTAASGRTAAVVLDVLGRYSVEWTPNWAQARWRYAMTFFEDTAEQLTEQMTFFDRPKLTELITTAAAETGVRLSELEFTDRSVLLGRHTATRAFNPAIPAFRSLVNKLADGETPVRPNELAFAAPTSGAPDEILAFFREWATGWQELLDGAGDPHTPLAGQPARALAAELLRYERENQRGLGAAHSLTATMLVT